MALPGRPRKPTQLKIVQGTARKDRSNPHEPKPKGNVTTDSCPEWFSDTQREHWARIMRDAPAGMVKHLDQDTLISFIVAADAHREATLGLRKTGMLVKGSTHNVVPSPFVAIQVKQAALMLRAAAELGFTPSSRSRVSVTEETQQDDPWAALADGT